MTGKDKGPRRSNENVMNLLQNSQFVEYILPYEKHLSFAGARSQKNPKLYRNRPGETQNRRTIHLNYSFELFI